MWLNYNYNIVYFIFNPFQGCGRGWLALVTTGFTCGYSHLTGFTRCPCTK